MPKQRAPGKRKSPSRGKMGSLLLLVAAVACLTAPPIAAKDIPYEWNGVPRIVAIGDIHGAHDNFVTVLRNAGLVDQELHWSGGKAHLVQLGDILDRGPDSRRSMDLLMKLAREAQRAEGRVHVLNGNHEAMNVVGILDYVSNEEFASYTRSGDTSARKRAFEDYFRQQRLDAKANDLAIPTEDEVREAFETKFPVGFFNHRLAFGRYGRYGRWIRNKNAAIRINGIVFSHGDWSEAYSQLGIEEVNRRVRDELNGRAPLEGGVTFDPNGPLFYRELARVPLERAEQDARREEVDRILENLEATRMIVGHTVTEGVIEPRFGGKHVSTDAGMLELYGGGHQVALEIEGDQLRAIHPLGKVTIPEYLDESTLFDYLVAVAAVDPLNVEVHTELAEQYQSQGNFRAARDTLEHVFRIQKPVAFRYHRELGDVYRELGETERAREQYLAYIRGLEKLIDSTPDNTNLIHLLARLSLQHDLQLDLAEDLMLQALGREPENASLRATFARLEAAQSAAIDGHVASHQKSESTDP